MKIIKYYDGKDIDYNLYEHVCFIMSFYDRHIDESHGYYNNIKVITTEIGKIIKQLLDGMKIGETKQITIDDMSIFKNADLFFDSFNLYINVSFNNEDAHSIGRYNDISKIEMVGDNIKFCPELMVSAKGQPKPKLIQKIIKSVGHEFMHAYHDYNIFKNSNGKLRLSNVAYKADYRKSYNSDNKIENVVSNILYLCDNAEKKSHISQIKQEIERYNGPLKTSKDLTLAIMSTETYSKIKYCIDGLAFIEDSCKASYNSRNDVCDIVSYYTNKKYENYKNDYVYAIDYLKHKLSSLYMKFYEHSSNIAYDVYLERNE